METHGSRGCAWLLFPFGFILLQVFLYYHVARLDKYSGGNNSSSSAQAREAGILLREYEVSPRVINHENYQAEFTDCWVEEQTRTEHYFIFLKKVIKLGKPRFVLNYQAQRLAPDPDSVGEAVLVPGSEGYGLELIDLEYTEHPTRLQKHQVANVPLSDGIDNDTVYFSIMRSWKDKRNYAIKAYPKTD